MERKKIYILILTLLLTIVAFMSYDTGANLSYVIPKRLIRLATMLIVSCSIAYSSIIFQTLTQNKILTPSIMGYESVFILLQTVIVFIYGDKTFQIISQTSNFFVSTLCMMLFSMFMYLLLFKRGKNNIYHLLLIGLILGTLFETAGRFLQVIIDPNEFMIIEAHLFATFNKMNTDLLLVSAILLAITFIIGARYVKYLDVIALGREQSINLGLDYNKLVQIYMILISVMVAISTALVGPITFLGILVTNITYQIIKSVKHKYLLIACCIVSCITVIAGQFLIEHVFNFSTAVSIIINFIGGLYFLYLIITTKQKI